MRHSYLYEASVPVFKRMLGNLADILGKAHAHAIARAIDPDVLLQQRLFPDMFPLSRQVQIACDTAKLAVARLSGQPPPSPFASPTPPSATPCLYRSSPVLPSLPPPPFSPSSISISPPLPPPPLLPCPLPSPPLGPTLTRSTRRSFLRQPASRAPSSPTRGRPPLPPPPLPPWLGVPSGPSPPPPPLPPCGPLSPPPLLSPPPPPPPPPPPARPLRPDDIASLPSGRLSRGAGRASDGPARRPIRRIHAIACSAQSVAAAAARSRLMSRPRTPTASTTSPAASGAPAQVTSSPLVTVSPSPLPPPFSRAPAALRLPPPRVNASAVLPTGVTPCPHPGPCVRGGRLMTSLCAAAPPAPPDLWPPAARPAPGSAPAPSARAGSPPVSPRLAPPLSVLLPPLASPPAAG